MRSLEKPECDGHSYDCGMEYDLSDGDFYFFESKLSAFMDMFEEAEEVIEEEENGHREFVWGTLTVQCNVEEVSREQRRLYWTITESESNA